MTTETIAPDLSFTDQTGQGWTWPADMTFKAALDDYVARDVITAGDETAILAYYDTKGGAATADVLDPSTAEIIPGAHITDAASLAAYSFTVDLGDGPLSVDGSGLTAAPDPLA